MRVAATDPRGGRDARDAARRPAPSPQALVVLAGMAVYAVAMGWACQAKLAGFGYGDFDLAIDEQSVWSILHGSLRSSLLGIPFLGNHMRLVLFAVAPLYALFPSPLLFLHLQTAALALGAWAVFRLACEDLPPNWAALAAWLYLLYPPLIAMNLYEFHPVALACPLLLGALLCYRRARFGGFAAFLSLAMLCQENIGLLAAGLGAYAFLDGRRGRWVWAPLIAGLVFSGICVALVMPRLNPGTVQFSRLYGAFGDSLPESLAGMLRRPDRVARAMFTPPKLAFLSALLAPEGYLSLLSPSRLVPALPVLLQRLLSSRLTETSIAYHYQAEFIPFVFFAAIAGIRRALAFSRFDARRLLQVLLTLFPAVALVASGAPARLASALREPSRDSSDTALRRRIVQSVPNDAAVLATFRFLPHLASRSDLYSLHHVYTGCYTLSDVPYPTPRTDVVLLDPLDALTFSADGFYAPTHYVRLQALLCTPGWDIEQAPGDLLVFRRASGPQTDAFPTASVESLPSAASRRVTQATSDALRLEAFEVIAARDPAAAAITLYWRWPQRLPPGEKTDCNAEIVLRGREELADAVVCPGLRVRPPQSWEEGVLVADRHVVRLSRPLHAGESLTLDVRLVPADSPAR